ncbi:MAG TPA: hypothetical protein VMW91_03805 [Desulfosporosinus sp.]|nr:hypothetical protein [Desulfosporosinus sp.]
MQDYKWDRKVRYYDGRVEDFVIPVHRHEGIQGSMSVPPFFKNHISPLLLAVYVNISVVVPREEMNNGIGKASSSTRAFMFSKYFIFSFEYFNGD